MSLGIPQRGHHLPTPAPPTTLGVPGALSHSLPFLGSVSLSSLGGARPHPLDFAAARGCLQALQSPRRAWLPAGTTVRQHKQRSFLLVLPGQQRQNKHTETAVSVNHLPTPCLLSAPKSLCCTPLISVEPCPLSGCRCGRQPPCPAGDVQRAHVGAPFNQVPARTTTQPSGLS